MTQSVEEITGNASFSNGTNADGYYRKNFNL